MIQDYPDIIALHLSRSIYDSYASRKNSAKVAFSEKLQMGGILDRKSYRLLCVVTHKGGHDSGHYECFRRQVVARPPFSTPTPSPSPGLSPSPGSTPLNRSSIRLVESLTPSSSSRTLSGESLLTPASTSAGSHSSPNQSLDIPRPGTPTSLLEQEKRAKAMAKQEKKRVKAENNRWWRISDEKIKEARTSDVLGMQKEVYLLFYQREKGVGN